MTTVLPPPTEAAELLALATVRLGDAAGEPSTLDAVLSKLFDRDEREHLTVSAFGSAL